MSPWLTIALTFLAAAAAGAIAYAFALARQQVRHQPLPEEMRAEVARLKAALEEERAAMRREFAASLEEAAGIGETVDRNRARVEQAEKRRKARDAREEAPPQPLTLMDVTRAARAQGKL